MHIILVGLNHRSAPIDVRERLAFHQDHLPRAFARLRQEVGLQESAILSTCNRVEIYAGVPTLNDAMERLQRFLSDHGRVDLASLSPQLYSYTEPQSIQHLFSVASGLDSMVLGESEILHQVKRAYELAYHHGTTGKVLNVLFQKALHTGKVVRAKTAIGKGALSIGTVAIELAQKIFGSLSPYAVLLVGAGKIGEQTLKHLAARGVSRMHVLNRSRERAQGLAQRYGASLDGLDQLMAQLLEVDIAVFSTASPEPLVARSQVARIMRQRRHRPLCLIDLGVPRNVEPAVGELENVYRFDIDDLQGLVDHHHAQRQQAVCESQRIVEQKVHQFLNWWQQEGCASVPVLSELAAVP